MILHSYAKLNLYLEILNLRKDNYHNIITLFERINLFDRIAFTCRRDSRIKMSCNSSDVPRDSSNLAFRAARLLQEVFNIKRGVDIELVKRIPVGAGLGGGSSNAATVLLGLNKLWKLKLSQDKLVSFARRLGSDVPFFIYNSPFAEGKGRGDRLRPLKALNNLRLWHILVVPKMQVSTPLIYRKWNELERLKKPALTRAESNVKIMTLALIKKDLAYIGKTVFNSLEEVSSRLYPEIKRIKERLIRLGLKAILMSGSGPAVFGIVSSRKEAVAISRGLKDEFSWQVFVTRTV